MSSTTNSGMSLLATSPSQPEVTLNKNLWNTDALVQLTIDDLDLSEPPGSPAEGGVYVLAASASVSSPWAGVNPGNLAHYFNSSWTFYTPKQGWRGWVKDEEKFVRFEVSTWGDEYRDVKKGVVSVNASSATTPMDTVQSHVFKLVLTQNASVVFSGASAGNVKDITVFTEQDGTGGRSCNFVGAIYASSAASTVSQTSSTKDVWNFKSHDGGTTWFGTAIGRSYK